MWALRSTATAMLFCGASMLMAGVPVAGLATEFAVIRAITGIFFQIGIVFIVAGATAMYLSRSGAPLFPNERQTTPDDSRTPLGGWLIVMVVAFVTLPVWLIVRLQSFFEEWARVLDYLATWDIWSGGDAGLSGFVLLPLFAALTPPLFELIAAAWLVVTSAALVVSLLSRSQRFPRIFVVSLLLSAALVVASVRAASAAAVAGSAVEQLIQDTSASAQESAALTEALQRYTGIVGSTAPVLVWALCGYLIWIPPLLVSRRVMTTFGAGRERRAPRIAPTRDLEAITSPPSFRG